MLMLAGLPLLVAGRKTSRDDKQALRLVRRTWGTDTLRTQGGGGGGGG